MKIRTRVCVPKLCVGAAGFRTGDGQRDTGLGRGGGGGECIALTLSAVTRMKERRKAVKNEEGKVGGKVKNGNFPRRLRSLHSFHLSSLKDVLMGAFCFH